MKCYYQTSTAVAMLLAVSALSTSASLAPFLARSRPTRHYAPSRVIRSEEEHAHGDHGDCSCEAAEEDHPFTIDCDNSVAINAASVTLGNCDITEAACQAANAGGVKECQQAFFIIQAHHDYCPHDTLTTDQELKMHDYEGVCMSCHVGREYNATYPGCGAPTCSDNVTVLAALKVLDENCAENGLCCTDVTQQDAFRTVLAYHDLCGEDVLTAVEDGIHSFEEACEDFWCNTETGPFDPNNVSECSEDMHAHEDEHAHGDCSCEAAEADHPFTIDCENSVAINAASVTLGNCDITEAVCQAANAGGVKECQQAFFIIQAHHDYCPHDTLTAAQELKMHDYEGVCMSCHVGRKYSAAYPACEAPTCSDNVPVLAALKVLDENCAENGPCCTDVTQQDAFRTVLAYHDLCGEDVLEAVEDGIHSFEEACEDYWCNTETGPFDPNKCSEDEDDDDSPATRTGISDGLAVFVVAATMLAAV